jgi:hypothetical protein
MWIVYVALAVALVVGIRYLRKLQAESKPKQPRTLKNFQSDWKREKRLQAREHRAKALAAALHGLSRHLETVDRSKQGRGLRKAEKLLDAMVSLDQYGRKQLEWLLMVVRSREVWLLVQKALWKTFERNGGIRAIDKINVLRMISEEGRSINARVWALGEMPSVLADMPNVWELALSSITLCWQEVDRQIADAAKQVLKPLSEARAVWMRDLICHMIVSSTSRPVMLFAIPATEGFATPADIEKALRSIWTCGENVLEGEIMDVVATSLRVHRDLHPAEYEKVAGEQQAGLRERITREVDDPRRQVEKRQFSPAPNV